MDKKQLVQEAANKADWDQVYQLYNEIYPDDMYDGEGLPAEVCVTQKAGLMNGNGKHEEAIAIYKTVLGMTVAQDGETGRGVLTIRTFIAGALTAQNKMEEALEILNDVLKIQIELMGDIEDISKPDMYDCRLLIANALEKQGKFDEALLLYEQVYDAYTQWYGSDERAVNVGLTITLLIEKMGENASSEIPEPFME